MTFIDICREFSPDLNANDNNTYQDYTKKLKDIFASLGIIEWLDSLKINGEFDFPDKSKNFILFLLKEYANDLAILRNESRQNQIKNKDIIYIYENIDTLFKDRLKETDLTKIKMILCDRFDIPRRYPNNSIENCEKQIKKTMDNINQCLLPEEARILLGVYYTKELCASIKRICKKWEDITDICDDYHDKEIKDTSYEESKKLSDSFASLNLIYTSIVADYFCLEDPSFELNDKLKSISGLEAIQSKICALISKTSKTGSKKRELAELNRLRKLKQELIHQQVEKELLQTGLDFSEVRNFNNSFLEPKKSPTDLVHEAIEYYRREH
ncbi:MAG: hypothetical protein K6C97_04355 [Treponema sp.]|nr:hypothetical protein [Treponema sp.]